MQHIKHAVIGAAGIGSRLGLDMPKCLVPIGDKRIIDYQLMLLGSIPDVRVVVGFQEEIVIDYVRNIRPDVTFVRNPDYLTTSNSYSIYLASRHLMAPYLMIDGDLVFQVDSFYEFLAQASAGETLIGITQSKTEEAVFVECNESGKQIMRFFREPRAEYEWSGLALFNNISIRSTDQYIFEQLERYLPLKCHPIECFEIDTPDDLDRAHHCFDELGYSLD